MMLFDNCARDGDLRDVEVKTDKLIQSWKDIVTDIKKRKIDARQKRPQEKGKCNMAGGVFADRGFFFIINSIFVICCAGCQASRCLRYELNFVFCSFAYCRA